MKVFTMSTPVSRRTFFTATAAAAAVTSLPMPKPVQAAAADPRHPFRYCLNTSTVRECQYQGKKVDIVGEVEYQQSRLHGNRTWIGELDTYVKNGVHCRTCVSESPTLADS